MGHICVFRSNTQRLPLAAAADQYGNLPQGLWHIHFPAAFDDFKRPLQRVKAAARSAKFIPIFPIITLKPTRAYAQDEPSIADMINRLCHVGKKSRVAIGIAGDKTTNFHPLCAGCHGCQEGPALVMIALRVAVQGEEVIPVPERINAHRLEAANSFHI